MKILLRIRSLLTAQKGFTLVELMVAIVILAVGIVGIVTLFPQSYTHIGNAGRLSVMNHIGQKKLDELKTLSYNHVDLMDGFHPSPGPVERISYVDSSGKDIYENYTIQWEVREDEPIANMKTIIVKVAHQLYDTGNQPLASSDAMNQKIIYFQTSIAEP